MISCGEKGNVNCAYCGSLESALIAIYEMMLLENVNEKQMYSRTLEDLRRVIVQKRNEFALLLGVDDLVKNSYKSVERQTPHGESDLSC